MSNINFILYLVGRTRNASISMSDIGSNDELRAITTGGDVLLVKTVDTNNDPNRNIKVSQFKDYVTSMTDTPNAFRDEFEVLLLN